MIKSSQRGYYDLNVGEACFAEATRKTTLEVLLSLGYRTVAVNQHVSVDDQETEPSKKKKKGEPLDPVPVPFNLQLLKDIVADMHVENVTFLNRLTLKFANQDSIQKYIKSENYKKYHLIGIVPTTTQAMSYACNSLDADILSVDLEYRRQVRISRKMYFTLVKRGYHFELMYSPAIQSPYKRQNLIHISHLYHTHGKSKNVIFTSGAENPIYLRGAYDIISMGCLFGLNELQSKNAILHCARNVTITASGRRQGKAVMIVETLESMEINEAEYITSDSDLDMETDLTEPAQKKVKQ